jgi:hypothetical protein
LDLRLCTILSDHATFGSEVCSDRFLAMLRAIANDESLVEEYAKDVTVTDLLTAILWTTTNQHFVPYSRLDFKDGMHAIVERLGDWRHPRKMTPEEDHALQAVATAVFLGAEAKPDEPSLVYRIRHIWRYNLDNARRFGGLVNTSLSVGCKLLGVVCRILDQSVAKFESYVYTAVHGCTAPWLEDGHELVSVPPLEPWGAATSADYALAAVVRGLHIGMHFENMLPTRSGSGVERAALVTVTRMAQKSIEPANLVEATLACYLMAGPARKSFWGGAGAGAAPIADEPLGQEPTFVLKDSVLTYTYLVNCFARFLQCARLLRLGPLAPGAGAGAGAGRFQPPPFNVFPKELMSGVCRTLTSSHARDVAREAARRHNLGPLLVSMLRLTGAYPFFGYCALALGQWADDLDALVDVDNGFRGQQVAVHVLRECRQHAVVPPGNLAPMDLPTVQSAIDALEEVIRAKPRWSVLRAAWTGAVATAAQVRMGRVPGEGSGAVPPGVGSGGGGAGAGAGAGAGSGSGGAGEGSGGDSTSAKRRYI